MINRYTMLQIYKPHTVDSERILFSGNINTGFPIGICIFRICDPRTVINTMKTVNAEIFKFYRAYSRTSVPLYIKCRTRCLVFGGRLQIDHDPAAARPQFVKIRPFFSRDIEADA